MSNATTTPAETPTRDAATWTADMAPDHDAVHVVTGLRNLALMIEQNPWLAGEDGPLRYAFSNINVWPKDREELAELGRIARRYGAAAEKYQNDSYAGLDLQFGARDDNYRGRVTLRASRDRDELCERVVVGTREVTREVPDPQAPKVTVTEVVEEVEWRCRPILADELPGGES